jgi:hypothetical protein
VKIRVRTEQRDPFWGLDGPAARGARRAHRVVAWAFYLLSAVILALVLARLVSVDPHALLGGGTRPVLLGSLAADALACVLVFAFARRRRALRFMGEVPAG